MRFVFDDGGRKEAGYKGDAGDCVCRAIAIATGKPYQEVYDALNGLGRSERTGRRKRRKSSARTGVYKPTIRRYLGALGWAWVPTMNIGSGCQLHLADGELPAGRLVVRLSRHLTAVLDGVIHDTYDPQRGGRRCVYGYFQKAVTVPLTWVPGHRVGYRCGTWCGCRPGEGRKVVAVVEPTRSDDPDGWHWEAGPSDGRAASKEGAMRAAEAALAEPR
jgi:hypothetical protein